MMCSCDQLRKLVTQVRPVGRMSLEPCFGFGVQLNENLNLQYKKAVAIIKLKGNELSEK